MRLPARWPAYCLGSLCAHARPRRADAVLPRFLVTTFKNVALPIDMLRITSLFVADLGDGVRRGILNS